MYPDYWIRQTSETLAYPEIEWSKPENKAHAGKLVIIGGNTHGFNNVAQAFTLTENAGAGSVTAILPDAALKQLAGTAPIGLEGAASNASGGFSRDSLRQILAFAAPADAVLLAGDFGRNSETAITMQELLKKYAGNVVITKDAVQYFITDPQSIERRPKTTVVVNLAQLQKLAKAFSAQRAILFESGISSLVEDLHQLTLDHPINIVTFHHNHFLVATGGMVSSTPHTLSDQEELWQLQTASKSAVYLMQHPGKEFEALTSSVL